MNSELLLKNIGKHIQLNKAETLLLLSVLQSKKLKRRELLLRQGDICQTENFIVKGCLRVYTIDENGFEHIIMFGIEDWWISDLLSFLSGTKTIYFIDALEETELLQISKNNLEKLYREVPKFERFSGLSFRMHM